MKYKSVNDSNYFKKTWNYAPLFTISKIWVHVDFWKTSIACPPPITLYPNSAPDNTAMKINPITMSKRSQIGKRRTLILRFGFASTSFISSSICCLITRFCSILNVKAPFKKTRRLILEIQQLCKMVGTNDFSCYEFIITDLL